MGEPKIEQKAKLASLRNYLWVVHEPHQAPLLGVQYEIPPQELAAALILLDVQKATDAVLSVHVRHLATGTFPGLLRPGAEEEKQGASETRKKSLKKRPKTGGGKKKKKSVRRRRGNEEFRFSL